MEDWLQSNEAIQFKNLIQSGCAEQAPFYLSVPLPYSFIEKALTYTANSFNKRTKERRWNMNSNSAVFRISATCDGNTLYLSFTCLSTGLSANIYTPVKNGRPFNVIVPRINLAVSGQAGRPWNWNSSTDRGFVLVASSEVFGILANGWNSNASQDTLFRDNPLQRVNLSGFNVGVGVWQYDGLRPFAARKVNSFDTDFIEYRGTALRSRRTGMKSNIHYGVENPIIDRIEPSAIVGVKPEHGRWLLNKAAKTTSKQKGELLIHYREETPMFFGVSPMGTELSLPYDVYGKAGKRGKYRNYSYSGKEHLITIARDSIGTKDITSLVNHSQEMYFGASDNKVILGWKVDDVTFLWEHEVQNTTMIHPLVDELEKPEITALNCDPFVLPNIRDDFRLPSFLQGYDNIEEEDEMTADEAKILIRWWNDHVNAEIMAGRRPTQESVVLFEKIKTRAD